MSIENILDLCANSTLANSGKHFQQSFYLEVVRLNFPGEKFGVYHLFHQPDLPVAVGCSPQRMCPDGYRKGDLRLGRGAR